ncbi:MAG: short-chain fatty acyl-CoA regulator family protein, partial [Pseudomonadota bacterium]
QHPERAVRQFAGFPNGQRLVFVARARPGVPVRYGAPLNLVTDMLMIDEEVAGATAYAPESGLKPEPVGTACRICPRDACVHRVEDPISG